MLTRNSSMRFSCLLLVLAVSTAPGFLWANAAPSVTLTSPANEFDDAIAPASLTLTATASDSDGSIAKVEFYQGSTLLGTDTSAPYTYTWTNVAAGRYSLTAKATDNGGAAKTSATVWITVNGPTVNGFLDKRFYAVSSSSGYMPYRLFVPANYSPSKKYPVVLFLHGVGEGGTDNLKQLNNNANGSMVFVNAANQAAYPCFMIAPQSASGWWSGNGSQVGIAQRIQAKYSTDVDRLYITGLSAGGMGTWATLITNPTLFAAAVPICGNGDTSKANLLINIPIWNFHAANDPTVSVSGSDSMISAIRAAGGNPIYTRYATGGHASWTPAYANPKTVPWVMAQRRGVAPTNAPLLTITAPTTQPSFATTNTTVNLSGTYLDSSAQVTQVAWSNSQGGSGTATLGATWAANAVPLKTGENLIQVIATGTSYSSGNGGNTTFNDTIRVTLTSGNLAPTIKSVTAQPNPVVLPSPTTLTVTATDPEGGTLTYAWSKQSGPGTVTFGSATKATSTATFTAAGNYTLAVKVSDGISDVSGSVTVTVTAAPADPSVVAAINCGGTDNYVAADGTIYTPDAYYNGGSVNNFVRAIANTADDPLYQCYRWLTGTLTYSIPVANGSYAVTLKLADVYSTAVGQKVYDVKIEGQTVVQGLDVFKLAGKDAAYDLTYTSTVSDGKLDLQFVPGAAGNPSINAILVRKASNRAPVANAQQVTTNEDTAKAIVLTATDPDGDAMTYAITSQPTHGTLTGSAPNVTYTPAANYNGTDSFTFTASDGKLTSAKATVSITVAPVNDAPVISSLTAQPNPLTLPGILSASVTATDVDNDTLTYAWSKVSGPGTASFSASVSASTSVNFSTAGSYVLRATVSDGKASATRDATITVLPVPPPVNSSVVAAINCGGTSNYTAADGTVYAPDAYYSGGSVNNFVRPIANTNDDPLYQCYRWNSGSLTYSIPLANGSYAVTLKFADVYSTAAGQKVFNVKVEGQTVVQGFDTFKLAGKDTAYDLTYSTTVSDGKLDLQFLAGVAGNPSINAILVKKEVQLRTPENPTNTTNGLDFAYFTGTWDLLPDFAALTPVKTGTVSNFDLGQRTQEDYYAFQYTGFVDAPTDGVYTFYTNSDDGSQLYIGSTLVVDNDGLHSMRERSGSIGLKAGKHGLTVTFFEKTGSAAITVSWEGPGLAKQFVPVGRLYRILPATADGLLGTYFDNQDLTGKTVTRVDPTINFDWGTTAPIAGIANDTYSIRWTGYIVPPTSGSYTFTARTDDGVRLWINGTLVIDYWQLRSAAESNGAITLTGGQKYSIKMEYYNGPTIGVAQLSWAGPGVAKVIVPKSALYSK